MRIVLDHNSAWGWTDQYLQSDGVSPVDCTGGTLAEQIRPEPGGQLLGEFVFAWVDAGDGIFSRRIEADAVNQIPDGTYRSDLIFTDSNGIPLKIESNIVIKQGTITEP